MRFLLKNGITLYLSNIKRANEKVFITGASGFLGRHVVAALNDCGVIRCAPKKRLHEISPFDLEGIGTVIHCAGLIPSRAKFEAELFNTNTEGTRNLIECCEKAGVGRFIFISSMGVKYPSAYAQSKLGAEEEVKRSHLNWIILRPAHIIGPNDEFEGLFKLLSRKAVCATLGLGNNPFHIVYVKDCASGIVKAALSEECNKTFNVIDTDCTERRYYKALRSAMEGQFLLMPLPEIVARHRYGASNLSIRKEGLIIPGIANWPVDITPVEFVMREIYEELKDSVQIL